MSIEQALAREIRNRGLKIRAVSEKTGIRYSLLQPSLKGRRELRADELLILCVFLGVDPLMLRNKAN